jgi:hypothetical protein
MPHFTRWEEDGIYWSFSGIVTLQEQKEADGEMYGDPRFDSLRYFIWDGTNISKIDYDEYEADGPAAIDKVSSTYRPNLKGALIANDESVRKIIKRYIKTSERLKSSWDLKMFDTIKQARDWLSN